MHPHPHTGASKHTHARRCKKAAAGGDKEAAATGGGDGGGDQGATAAAAAAAAAASASASAEEVATGTPNLRDARKKSMRLGRRRVGHDGGGRNWGDR